MIGFRDIRGDERYIDLAPIKPAKMVTLGKVRLLTSKRDTYVTVNSADRRTPTPPQDACLLPPDAPCSGRLLPPPPTSRHLPPVCPSTPPVVPVAPILPHHQGMANTIIFNQNKYLRLQYRSTNASSLCRKSVACMSVSSLALSVYFYYLFV